MRLYTYTTIHRPEHPSAPEPVSTLVTPNQVGNPGPLVRSCMDIDPGVVKHVNEHALDFPALPTVEAVCARYDGCARCHLSERRTRVCHFKGNANATVVALGEGPGRAEDTRGIPFCGQGGKLQDGLLREVGIDPLRDLAWINLVGCRPCDNRYASDRPPSEVEKIACSEHLTLLLRAIRPRVVLCLGDQATALFWDKPPPPNTWHTIKPREAPQDWIVVGVARHPEYLLRSVVSRYQEYFAARMFLMRLKARMPSLTHPDAWRLVPRYVSSLLSGKRPLAGC